MDEPALAKFSCGWNGCRDRPCPVHHVHGVLPPSRFRLVRDKGGSPPGWVGLGDV